MARPTANLVAAAKAWLAEAKLKEAFFVPPIGFLKRVVEFPGWNLQLVPGSSSSYCTNF